MTDLLQKLGIFLQAACALVALLIIADFVFPGGITNDQVLEVIKKREDYKNAARGYHFSYKVITTGQEISVKEEFARLVHTGDTVEYSVSRIFNEVNWYKLDSSEDKSYYSLRLFTGLVLPALVLISLVAAYLFKKNGNTLVIVFQILLIADLVFLMM
ncbi:MAG: hypothetical protein AAGI38_05310 [Bacteroidota bacterium]